MHVPALVRETLEFLDVRRDGIYVDATLGGGGHAEAILQRLAKGKLLGIDRDRRNLDRARERLATFKERTILMAGNFAEIDALHRASGLAPADGVIADLGVSSMQLDESDRGFSFMREGPLDMRMDPESGMSAADIVNHSSERELADLIFKLGEERHSRAVARAIVKARPFRTTTELAQVVTRAIPSRAGLHQIHPATRTFQALRMAVNREVENLDAFLGKVLTVVAPGGRVVVLSYHSLEDRLVKHAFQFWRHEGQAQILTPKVIRAAEEEVARNPRSRSAKLRAAEKLPADDFAPVREARG